MYEWLLFLETNVQAFLDRCHKAVDIVEIVKILFYFIVVDICLALTAAQANKHRYCSGHNLGKDKLKR